MPDVYVKNGKTYKFGPMSALDEDGFHLSQERGKNLQKFFDENGIGFDLQSGTGIDKDNFYYLVVNSAGYVTRETKKVFDGTNYSVTRTHSEMQKNLTANAVFKTAYGDSLFKSTLLFYKSGEDSPRILFSSKDGIPELSEPVNKIAIEDYAPKKPGVLAGVAHALNKNWYNKEFADYEKLQNDYDVFKTEFPTIKEEAEKLNAIHSKELENMAKNTQIIAGEAEFLKTLEMMNERIDGMLGPGAKDAVRYQGKNAFTDHETAIIAYSLFPDKKTFFDGLQGNGAAENADEITGKSVELVSEYMKGNKAPLAKALGDGIRMQNNYIASFERADGKVMAMMDASSQTFALLKKDPELMAKSGLTERETVQARAMNERVNIYKKAVSAEAKLQDAALGNTTLTSAEKSEFIADMFMDKLAADVEYRAVIGFKTSAKAEERPLSSITKLLGSDDNNHKNVNDLREKIKNTALFNEFMAKPIEEIGDLQRKTTAREDPIGRRCGELMTQLLDNKPAVRESISFKVIDKTLENEAEQIL